MPASRDDLMARLDALGIETTTYEHPPLFTVEQSRELRGTIPGAHTKNLFMKDKKGVLWLIVALEDARIDLKTLHAVIGSARLSFANADLLRDVLGVEPGSVTPFALINDAQSRVRVVFDQTMMAQSLLNFHPLRNDATNSIRPGDLLSFATACGHEPAVLDVTAG